VQGDEHPEDESAPDHDLLDVAYLDVVAGEGAEQACGDAGPVGAGDSEKRP
jgi:hypothetical protein